MRWSDGTKGNAVTGLTSRIMAATCSGVAAMAAVSRARSCLLAPPSVLISMSHRMLTSTISASNCRVPLDSLPTRGTCDALDDARDARERDDRDRRAVPGDDVALRERSVATGRPIQVETVCVCVV